MSYIVASPGRTGSNFLVRYLIEYESLQNNIIYFKHIDFNDNIEDSVKFIKKDNVIIHTHDVQSLLKQSFNTKKLILIRRNPVEITVSYYIAEETGTYNFLYQKDDKNIGADRKEYIEKFHNTKFSIDESRFLRRLKYVLDWYIDFNVLQDSIIFNYSESVDVNTINQKLDLNQNNIDTSNLVLTSLQPFNKWNKVENPEYFQNLGNKIFKQYQKKYPNIFIEEDFIIDSQA